MKKAVSIICCVGLILSSVMFIFPALAFEDTSIEEFAEDMSELYAEESADGKELEDSVVCRVIVKATSKPDTYKNAECVVGNNNRYIYQYSDAETAQEAVDYYNSLPYVKWAELDGVVEGQALSYGNYMVQGDEAKEYITKSNLSEEEITVAVLDTGIYFDLEEFKDRVFDSGFNSSTSGTPNSGQGDATHGSHVARIIIDNSPENVKISSYKVLNKDLIGSSMSLALGIEQAVLNGVDVINMSCISYGNYECINEAVDFAHSKGVILVCSAGNEGDDVSNYSPASLDDKVITVGSIDRNGNHSFFSNYGEEVDFVAPGHYIEVDSNVIDSGTSFSAPFVTAAVSTLLTIAPDYSFNDVLACLKESCIQYDKLAYHDGFHAVYDCESSEYETHFYVSEPENERLYYGFGMPQIAKAVAIATGNYQDVKQPILSSKTGIYNESFLVSINVPEDYEVYYTSDESYPSKSNGILYAEPVYIEESQSIRAVAYSPDGIRSEPVSGEYKMQYYADESDFVITSKGYIDDYTGSLKEFIVPDSINGIEVTGVNARAFYRSDIIGIVLPETASFIGDSAFSRSSLKYLTAKGLKIVDYMGLLCEELIELDAPNITTVYDNGIACTKLRTLDLPKLTEAYYGAFAENKNLKHLNLPSLDYVCEGLSERNVALKTVKLDSAVTIDASAFSYCFWLKDFYAPNVKEFVRSDHNTTITTFAYCHNITELSFPNLISTGDYGAFQCLYNLETINLPSVEYIGKLTFGSCYSLNSLYAPLVTEVGDYAFINTLMFQELTLEKVTTFGDEVFRGSGIKVLYAPELRNIGEYTFSDYNAMYYEYLINNTFEMIYAPKLETASDYAFAYTGALNKLELPSLTDLGKNAFFESSVSYLDAPKLQNASSLPAAENSIAILSSKFSECSLDANGYSLTIYGTPDTYAQTYAEQYGLTFINAPVIINDLPSEYFEGKLTVDVAGFDKTYQWYGTNNPSGKGTMLSNETDNEIEPSSRNFKYYYCVVTSDDNGYTGSVKTNLCQNMLYSASVVVSDARIIIAKSSEQTIKYGESTVLYANATGLPEGTKIKWRIVEGNGVKLEPSASGTSCTVTSKSNGNVTIEAYAVDKNGNIIVNENGNRIYDREGIKSEVSLWWIILYYIRKIFSVLK